MAIILFTLLIKIVLLPISIKQQKVEKPQKVTKIKFDIISKIPKDEKSNKNGSDALLEPFGGILLRPRCGQTGKRERKRYSYCGNIKSKSW